jgi:hypothetical protein
MLAKTLPWPATAAAPKTDLERRHDATVRFGERMKRKLLRNEHLALAIRDHCVLYDVHLPRDRNEFKRTEADVLRRSEYGAQLADLLTPLIKLYYLLQQKFATFAEFGGEEKAPRLVPLTYFYSKHRLDYAWNLRKSQLVRQRYVEFLATARDEAGRLLIDHYHPVQLTLTVPHAGGTFRGEPFYARELLDAYAQLRKTEAWKRFVYAGEYGVEVKPGKSGRHGLHIHTHSFILQYPEFTVNEVREALAVEWKAIVGNTTRIMGLDYRTLYCKKKNKAGVTEKVDLIPGVSPLADYMAGVMECIKYHFKPDCLTKVGGGFDMPLIIEVLANTHNLRMYSRFGAFYKQPALNFNRLHDAKPLDELSTDELEEEVQASSDGVEERLVDPRSMTAAAAGSYRLKVGNPLALGQRSSDGPHAGEAYEVARRAAALLTVPPGLTLKQVIRFKMVAEGYLEEICRLSGPELADLLAIHNAEEGRRAKLRAGHRVEREAAQVVERATVRAQRVVVRAQRQARRRTDEANRRAQEKAARPAQSHTKPHKVRQSRTKKHKSTA